MYFTIDNHPANPKKIVVRSNDLYPGQSSDKIMTFDASVFGRLGIKNIAGTEYVAIADANNNPIYILSVTPSAQSLPVSKVNDQTPTDIQSLYDLLDIAFNG